MGGGATGLGGVALGEEGGGGGDEVESEECSLERSACTLLHCISQDALHHP